MLKALLAAILLAPLMAGCQAATAPTAPLVSALAAKPLAAPRLVDSARLRRVLQASDGSMSIFGITYTQGLVTRTDSKGTEEIWNVNAYFTDKVTLIKASRNRYIYEVPDGQVLILNQTQGSGAIDLNGYGYTVPQASMSYIFGPGETVVFTFSPRQIGGINSGRSSSFTFDSLAISGYTGSPELLGKLGLAKGK